MKVLDASPATVGRDLRTLEQQGLLVRDHGGAAARDPIMYEPFLHDSSFKAQIRKCALEKQRIGMAAAQLIHDSEMVGIGGGTTVAKMLRGLYLSGDWFALVGPRALESVPHFFLDKFIFGATGVHAESGVTDVHMEESAMNRAMLQQARTKILLADHTKLGVISKCLVCSLAAVNIIITDNEASPELVKPFESAGIEVRRV